jgi:hypothetical protein
MFEHTSGDTLFHAVIVKHVTPTRLSVVSVVYISLAEFAGAVGDIVEYEERDFR